MKWTGERLVTDVKLGTGVVDHLHRYGFVQSFVKNKRVLDIASGEGYGSYLISKNATFVFGVDISEDAVLHASQKYIHSNLKFLIGSAERIPLPDHSIDVVVSFETIEHHDKHDEMFAEIKRVLEPNGILIISTPEKYNYRKVEPNNPYHAKELDLTEFKCLVSRYFKETYLLHQLYLNGSLIYPEEGNFKGWLMSEGDFEEIRTEKLQSCHLFNIAVASDYFGKMPLDEALFYFNGNSFNDQRMDQIYSVGFTRGLDLAKSSRSYRIGQLILLPLRFIKSLLAK